MFDLSKTPLGIRTKEHKGTSFIDQFLHNFSIIQTRNIRKNLKESSQYQHKYIRKENN